MDGQNGVEEEYKQHVDLLCRDEGAEPARALLRGKLHHVVPNVYDCLAGIAGHL